MKPVTLALIAFGGASLFLLYRNFMAPMAGGNGAQMPRLPAMPQMPAMPSMPKMPQMPGMPPMPQMRDFNGATPNAPRLLP